MTFSAGWGVHLIGAYGAGPGRCVRDCCRSLVGVPSPKLAVSSIHSEAPFRGLGELKPRSLAGSVGCCQMRLLPASSPAFRFSAGPGSQAWKSCCAGQDWAPGGRVSPSRLLQAPVQPPLLPGPPGGHSPSPAAPVSDAGCCPPYPFEPGTLTSPTAVSDSRVISLLPSQGSPGPLHPAFPIPQAHLTRAALRNGLHWAVASGAHGPLGLTSQGSQLSS